jgi:hypothetical protein
MSALIVIRPAALALLTQRCAVAMSVAPHLAAVVERVLLPARTLQALADLAVPALGDDPSAPERLRLLLAAVATPFEIDHAAAQQALGTPKGLAPSLVDASAADAGFIWPAEALVDLGAVVILGLACIRAGAPLGLGSSLLGTLSGLVLATSPAEAVLRWLRLTTTDTHFVNFLETFSDIAAGRNGLYRTFARHLLVDQGERARWRCILALFGKKGLQADARNQQGWIAAHADGLQSLHAEAGDDRYRLGGNFPPPSASTSAGLLAVAVVGRRGVLPERLWAEVLEWTDLNILVRIPGGIAGGWVGFSSSGLVDSANTLRLGLRQRWHTPSVPGLEDVPVELIPLIPPIPRPPRVLTAPPLQIIAVTQEGVDGPPSWRVAPGERLRVVVNISSGGQPAWAWIEGASTARSRIEKDRIVFTVPAGLGNPGARVTVKLAEDPETEAVDEQSIGPIQRLPVQRVVLILPTLVIGNDTDEVDDEVLTPRRADAALAAAARRTGLIIQRQWLPTVADDLAVLYGPVNPQDGRLDGILSALQRTAVCTPGAEDALWLALLPGDDAWQRHQSATAAALVAVSTVAGLDKLLASVLETANAPMSDPQEVLRLAGSVDRQGGIAWQSVRQESRRLPAQRASPANAPLHHPSLIAVVLDAQGHVIHEQPLLSVAPVTDDHLALLIPLAMAAVAVEIRQRFTTAVVSDHDVTVARVVRPTSSLQLSAKLAGDRVQWQVSQADGLPEFLTLEAALAAPQQLGWTEVNQPAPESSWTKLEGWSAGCEEQHQPQWSRYALRGVLELRLVADDGWHSVAVKLSGPPPKPAATLRIRRMADGRLWADGAGTPAWSAGGVAVGGQRLLSVEQPGKVELRMGRGSRTVRDHLAIALSDMGV